MARARVAAPTPSGPDAAVAAAVPARGSTRGDGSARPGFIAIVAACMAVVALGIDMVLPAFPEMRSGFGLAADSTRVALVITTYFVGLALGQLFYGPASDRYGRKPLLYVGLALYVLGAAGAALAPSLALVALFRFFWGMGAAGPRSLAIAMVRDSFEGDRMARTMSFVMAVFMIVPVVAPSIGALILLVAPWRGVFWFAAVAAVVLAVCITRVPETLPPQRRRPVTPAALVDAGRVVVRSRPTVAFGLAVMFLFATMASYLSSSEIIIEDVFGYGDQFPLIFGAMAIGFALATLLNARLVVRLGLHTLLRRASAAAVVVAVAFVALSAATSGRPPFWAYAAVLMALLVLLTTLLPNCNTAAMGPVGHVAGTAAALLGTLSTAGGALLGSRVDKAFDGTVTPFAIGALVFVACAALCVQVGVRGSTTVPPAH